MPCTPVRCHAYRQRRSLAPLFQSPLPREVPDDIDARDQGPDAVSDHERYGSDDVGIEDEPETAREIQAVVDDARVGELVVLVPYEGDQGQEGRQYAEDLKGLHGPIVSGVGGGN